MHSDLLMILQVNALTLDMTTELCIEQILKNLHIFVIYFPPTERVASIIPWSTGAVNQTTGLDRIPTSTSRLNPTRISIWLVEQSSLPNGRVSKNQ